MSSLEPPDDWKSLVRCILKAMPEKKAEDIAFLTSTCGAINDIYIFSIYKTKYVLRVRARELDFRYEKEATKEPAIAQFLSAQKSDQSDGVAEMSQIISNLLAKTRGGPIPNPLGANVIMYDHTREIIPRFWSIQECLEGLPLSDINNLDSYRALGRTLSLLHSRKFSRYKRSIFGDWLPIEAWFDTAASEIKSRLGEAAFLGCALQLSDFSDKKWGDFVLVHNDIQPTNVLISEGIACLIDWDNTQIAPRELEFAKLKHWTRLDNAGFFIQDEMLFQEVLGGYTVAEYELDNKLLLFCELLWLSRIYTFELLREQQGHVASPPFPPASIYLDELKARFGYVC